MYRRLLPFLLTASSVFAIYIRDDRPVASYNALGTDSRFAASGYVGLTTFGSFCSGTLISANTVLTAGHCVDEDANGVVDHAVSQMAFGVEANVPALVANVSSVIINPFWISTGGSASFDLALLTLSTPINTVTPAMLGYMNPAGLAGVMIGYGYQGTGTTNGSPGGANDRLGAENIIDFVGTTLRTDFDSPNGTTNSFGSSTPENLEGTTAPGDSGGALYALVGGTPYLVGVLNGGFNPYGSDSFYGDISIYARVANAENQQFLANNGFSAVPEPGTWLMGAAGLAALAVRRYKTARSPRS